MKRIYRSVKCISIRKHCSESLKSLDCDIIHKEKIYSMCLDKDLVGNPLASELINLGFALLSIGEHHQAVYFRRSSDY